MRVSKETGEKKKYLEDKGRCVLVAGQESLSAQDSSLGVDMAFEDVDGDNVGALLVGVLHPVASGDLSPVVLELVGCLEELHLCFSRVSVDGRGSVSESKVRLCVGVSGEVVVWVWRGGWAWYVRRKV